MADPRSSQPIAIIGAGLAGLTAAVFLKRHRVPFLLFEAGPTVGGLAASSRDEDGFTYDCGAHFITNRLAAALGVGSRCHTIRHYGESVWLDGASYSYPFGLLKKFSFVRAGLRSSLFPPGPLQNSGSAAEWFERAYGREFAARVAIPLLESWSGVPATALAPSVGWKLRNSIGKTLFLALAARLSHRAVACGYSHEIEENGNVWHVYPETGLDLLCRRLADEVGPSIRLESPVEQILVDGGRAVGIQSGGRVEAVSGVVSTAPCPVLSRMVRGTEALAAMSRFRYRPIVIVNLRLRGRGLLPDTVVWLPDRRFPFFRLTESPQSVPWLAPEGKTLITADVGCGINDATWSLPDEEVAELVLEPLSEFIPDVASRYLGCRVQRTPVAYPLYLNEYESERVRFARSTGVDGLLAVGRNAEFAHLLMEDVYWRTLRRSREFVFGPPDGRWEPCPLAQVS